MKVVAGDFNGNGLTDLALVRQTPGWGSIPIAFANGDGTWNITNGPVTDFITSWASAPGVKVIAGDFTQNGLTDLALVRQTPGWSTHPGRRIHRRRQLDHHQRGRPRLHPRLGQHPRRPPHHRRLPVTTPPICIFSTDATIDEDHSDTSRRRT